MIEQNTMLKRRNSSDSERQLIDLETMSSRENSETASPSPDTDTMTDSVTEASTILSSLPELSQESDVSSTATLVAETDTKEEEGGSEQAMLPDSPPSYLEIMTGWKLTYVDFGPRCLSAGGILTKPRFERFDSMIARANRWLKYNIDLRLRSIETIEMSASSLKEGESIDTQHVVRRFNAQDRYHFRVLRLWLVPRVEEDDMPVQQVGYLNIMPACTSPGGLRKKPTFDSLATTIEKYNKLMENRPLPGSVLGVETLRVKYCQWRELPDPDACYWSEHNHFRTSFLRVIRIYYISGPPTKEIIGWQDFDPKPIHDSGSLPSSMLPGPRYEGADTLLAYGRNWLVANDSIRLTNIQTLDNKLRKGHFKEEKDVLLSETPLFATWYLQSLRFYYVQDTKPPIIPNHDLYAHMTVKSFFPRQEAVVSFISQPEEETMTATMNKFSAWLDAYPGTVIIGVETLEAQCSRRRHNLRQTNSNFIMYGVRIYSTKMFPEQSNSIPVPEEEEDFSESDWDAILNAKPDPTDLEGQHQDQCLEHQQSHDLERQTSHDRQSHNLERQQSNLKHQRSHERQQSHDSEMPSVIHRDKQTTDSSYRVSVSSSVHFADEPVVCD